ncbi:MAG: hypothetical protein EXS17_07770 [Phycisphaerales bacterium]|nr:hypothetical protein [Phycisphaerales bacterium]
MRSFLVMTVISACTATAAGQGSAQEHVDLSNVTVDESINTPVEATIADRGALNMPGRGMPYELAMPQGFDRVYAVPGRPGLFYRASGGLYAVFTEGEYKRSKQVRRMTLVPANTRYYIGKPDWATIVSPSDTAGGSVMAARERAAEESAAPNEIARVAQRSDEIDANVGRPAPERSDVVYAPIGKELPAVPGNEAGFGGGSARPSTATDAKVGEKASEFVASEPDVAAWMGVLPVGVNRALIVGEGGDVRPRMVADFLYRQQRLAQLMQRATSGASPQ